MLLDLEKDLKNIFLAGVGAVALTAEKSEALVKELVKKGELTVEQGKALNEELRHKFHETVEETKAAFTPKPDVSRMTKEERDELRRKLDELDQEEQHDGEKPAE